MSNETEIISLILDVVQIDMNNRTEEIKNNLLSVVQTSNSNEEAIVDAVLQSVKFSTFYSVKSILEIFHELGFVDLNRFQCQNVDAAKARLHSASHLQTLNNQNFED